MHGPGPAGSPLIIRPFSMHQLFRLVLGQKDLSRAGDLFSLEDSEIEDSLTEALEQIKIISSSSIGFVLYPPSGGPAWDLTDHDNVMFISICFCWHYATALTIVGAIYAFVTWLVKSRFTRFCPSEVGLLKNAEREQESEEEM